MSVLSTVIASPSLLPGSLWAFCSGCFRAGLTAIVGASVFWLALFSYFPPYLLCHNILPEPAATVFLKTDLVQTPVLVTYGRYLELIEWGIFFKIISPSELSGSTSVNVKRASLITRNLPGVSFSPCSMSANLPYWKVSEHSLESCKNTSSRGSLLWELLGSK